MRYRLVSSVTNRERIEARARETRTDVDAMENGNNEITGSTPTATSWKSWPGSSITAGSKV